jgi:hypothetical protein
MNARISLPLGGALVAVALIGFLTVADDLRHTGEFFAVLGILVSGAALLVAGWFPRAASVLALAWVPVGIALGALAGALTDRVVLGVCIGTAAGLVLARLRRTPSAPQRPAA